MPEYSKLKNAELEALLKGRGLATGGKKADMVERLIADDEAEVGKGDEGAKTTILHPEDEIDWDDDADDAPAEPAKAVESAKVDEVAKPVEAAKPIEAAGPSVKVSEAVATKSADPKTADLAVKSPEEDKAINDEAKVEEKKEEAPAPAPVDYSKGLAATDIEKELEKRKARAARFKLDVDKEKDAEIEKNLLRAKKFEAPQAIDQALPERKRKRGGDGEQGAGRNKRGREDNQGGRNNRRGGGGDGRGRNGGRRGNRAGDDRRDNNRGDNRPARQENKSQAKDGPPSWMNAEERAKYEQRKNKFAAPATT